MAVADDIIADLTAQAAAWFAAEDIASADRRVQTVALLRYHGQGGELPVAWGASRAEVEAAFAGRTARSTASVSTPPSNW